jgi:hypothetical protein
VSLEFPRRLAAVRPIQELIEALRTRLLPKENYFGNESKSRHARPVVHFSGPPSTPWSW